MSRHPGHHDALGSGPSPAPCSGARALLALGGSLLLSALLLASGCRTQPPPPRVYGPRHEDAPFRSVTNEVAMEFFQPSLSSPASQYADSDTVASFSEDSLVEYRLGPGDRFAFLVRGRPDISLDDVIVSPDGKVALPRVGILSVRGRTLRDITGQLVDILRQYYESPDVTLVMKEYNNNRVHVLGRVANPGAINFQGQGTLLEALSLAGGLPVDTEKTFLTRCMVLRGNEMVLWIDLRDLLEGGNLALNPRLQNGDFVYIPQSEDQVAFVMGEVLNPGILLLRSEMTLLDALMNSGGLTRNANPKKVHLVRAKGGMGVVQDIDLGEIVERGDFRQNYVLRNGDIIYVSERGISKFNYFITRLIPSMDVIDFTLSTSERFGAMAELRRKIWGQEGFVNSSH